jgi:hypothetical protein
VFLFPDEKITKNYKVKEEHVTDFLQSRVDLPQSMVLDRRISGGCSQKRPDVFIDRGSHVVFVEVDENAHRTDKYCSCENKRMMQLFVDVAQRPVVFVRFNPDGYFDSFGVKIKSCFRYHKTFGVPIVNSQTLWNARLFVLLNRILHHIEHVPDKHLTVEHLFYDGFHPL